MARYLCVLEGLVYVYQLRQELSQSLDLFSSQVNLIAWLKLKAAHSRGSIPASDFLWPPKKVGSLL